ncbi:hypothetical protein EXA21_04700 [Vibrio cincinnatiensis]|uniref:hypothetical protein n=1 Tax=Vibrio cincinnatiensis TaxID=675 RepID=UPI001EDF69DA|nr:hypothetical protein [Vibrio cincinnatiensis]MCG3758855.1 hypothetical protein [Vibrio cincinnatiensis]MCG3762205.1 hypothetical protein [Vibrio cincinnatiensis]
MSKNPIKGYVCCHMPDCGAVSTVHAVGEHKIITAGEPPKNKRNVGRLYYNCPNCGFQQGKGEAFQSWIKSHMKESKGELKPLEALPAVASNGDGVTLYEPEEAENKPALELATETPAKPIKTRLEAAKPWLIAMGALALFIMYQLRAKEKTA